MTDEPHDRLRTARIKKGYARPADAARAFGWNENAYKSHENGVRGLRPEVAEKYARAFGVSAAHLIYGQTSNSIASAPKGSVPIVGQVSAGVFTEDGKFESVETQVPFVPHKVVSGDDQYALIIAKDSANKRFSDGSFAICVPIDKLPGGTEAGSFVHVVREFAGMHEHTIHEVRYTASGLALHPISTKPGQQYPIALNESDGTTSNVHGVVIGSFTAF